MNEKENKFYPLTDREDACTLKPVTYGNYAEMKMVQLRCSAVDKSAKVAICREFNLDAEKELVNSSEFGLEELYRKYTELLFEEDLGEFDSKDMNISEINRAAKLFFQSAAG